MLQKFGIPPKMLRLIIRFHSDLIVKVSIGDDDVCFNSTTGVNQGCTMAPLLFAIYFQAAVASMAILLQWHALMVTMELPVTSGVKPMVPGQRQKVASSIVFHFIRVGALHLRKSKPS